MLAKPLAVAAGRDLQVGGFKLGHGSDLRGMTGVTVILCPEGAVAAADVRGSATGTRQFDSLVGSTHLASAAHALVLAGGSAFGLSAADPVARWLERTNSGFDTGLRRVPIVPTAILFDLGFGDPHAAPGTELVEKAIREAATGNVACGSVGVGTGATVGKALGPEWAMKGGFGFASMSGEGGLQVAAAVGVNAFGDVRNPDNGAIVAGCRDPADGRSLRGADQVLAARLPEAVHPWEGNTSLGAVLTNARLSKRECLKVSEMAFGGYYRTLLPALTLYDGDLVVTLASGQVPAHLHQVAVLAEKAMAEAILRAVQEADGFGLLPAVRDLF